MPFITGKTRAWQPRNYAAVCDQRERPLQLFGCLYLACAWQFRFCSHESELA
jgi:hypothetical protein